MTGAGRGLGRAIALGLSRAGFLVALTARSTEELARTADEVRALGGTARAIVADVRRWEEVQAAVVAALELGGHIDVLVNAAGTSPYYKQSERLEPDEWDVVLETNLRGTFYFCRTVGAHMLSRGRGSIVNITSVLGTTAGASRLAAYCASKGGVDGLTKALAVEWADRGLRVNAVAPAFFETQLTSKLLKTDRAKPLLARTPMGRFGEAQEVVGAVLFLASESASYVTGSTIFVDGGWQAG